MYAGNITSLTSIMRMNGNNFLRCLILDSMGERENVMGSQDSRHAQELRLGPQVAAWRMDC